MKSLYTQPRTVLAIFIFCMGGLSIWAEDGFTVLPENPTTVSVLRDGESYLDIGFVGWGPNWGWMGFRGEMEEHDDATRLVCTSKVEQTGADIRLTAEVRKSGPRQLKLDLDLRTSKDTDLTTIVVSITMADSCFARWPSGDS